MGSKPEQSLEEQVKGVLRAAFDEGRADLSKPDHIAIKGLEYWSNQAMGIIQADYEKLFSEVTKTKQPGVIRTIEVKELCDNFDQAMKRRFGE